ncbi:MAG: hypothetical protein WA102_11685 [Candidatus Methanoperedens sp.]
MDKGSKQKMEINATVITAVSGYHIHFSGSSDYLVEQEESIMKIRIENSKVKSGVR